MHEYGRNLVWQAVDEALLRYSRQGYLKTTAAAPLEPPEPGGPLGKAEDLTPPRDLPRWLLDDIAAEVSHVLQKKIDAYNRARAGAEKPEKKRPGWLKAIDGGKDDSDETEGTEVRLRELPRDREGDVADRADEDGGAGSVGAGCVRVPRLPAGLRGDDGAPVDK